MYQVLGHALDGKRSDSMSASPPPAPTIASESSSAIRQSSLNRSLPPLQTASATPLPLVQTASSSHSFRSRIPVSNTNTSIDTPAAGSGVGAADAEFFDLSDVDFDTVFN